MGPPKLKRSASSSVSRNYRLEPSLSYSSKRRNSTLTNNDDIMEDDDDDDEQDPDDLEDRDDQDNRQDEEHASSSRRRSSSVDSIEREMTLKDRQEVSIPSVRLISAHPLSWHRQ